MKKTYILVIILIAGLILLCGNQMLQKGLEKQILSIPLTIDKEEIAYTFSVTMEPEEEAYDFIPAPESKEQTALEADRHTYAYSGDFEYEYMDYADSNAVESLRQAYSKIDYSWKFPEGSAEKREFYIEKYYEFLNDKILYVEPETRGLCCFSEVFKNEYKGHVEENIFWFFDINEDGMPELGIADRYSPKCEYIFQYDEELNTVSLWQDMDPYVIQGSKVVSIESLGSGGYFVLYRLEENGEIESAVFFEYDEYYGKLVFIVGYPWYRDEEPNLPEAIKEQAFYDISNDCYWFRVTGEVFDELSAPYFKMLEETDKGIEKVQYTYDELFGACK